MKKTGNIKDTLSKKVSLKNEAKDINTINLALKDIHIKNENQETIRTTIHLPIEVHRKLKIHCASKAISFKDYVTEAVLEKFSTET